MFQNWGNGEPNGNAEDYLQISQAIQPDGSTGAWNDSSDTRTSGATYQPLGYVRETDQASLQQQSNVIF